MADEEQDDVELDESESFDGDAPEDLEEEIEEVEDAPAADDFDDDDDFEEEEAEVVAEVPPAPAAAKPAARTKRKSSDDDDEEEEDDDDDADDDVEADLDTILKDRIAAAPEDDEDEDDEQPEPDDRGDGAGRIQPKRPGEFVCQSCFLVKHPSQLADPDSMLCADCV
jgi:hypothetical protein